MSELRRDPITGRWVILAPDRTRRPSDFTPPRVPPADASLCPFCEGREHIAGRELLSWRSNGGAPDTPGWDVRVVANREPTLRIESELGPAVSGLFQHFGNLGAHEVIIEAPRHAATWATLTPEELWRVLWAWRERIRDLKRDVRLKSVVVVKNHGRAAGAKLDHPHSQLLAYPFAPPTVELEVNGATSYYAGAKACVFCDLVRQEIELNRRVIASDEETVTLAPYAPRLPFETWILPRVHAARFEDSSDALLLVVARRLQDLVRRLDRTLLEPPFHAVLHTAPGPDAVEKAYHWHIEVLPRVGSVSGVGWGSGVYVNPVPPEEAAHVLRAAV